MTFCPLCRFEAPPGAEVSFCPIDGQRLLADRRGGLLADTYRLLNLAGVGHRGSSVWEAECDAGEVAVKLIESTDPAASDALLASIANVSAADHPAFPKLLALGQWKGQIYTVTAFFDGDTLMDRFADGPMNLDEALALTRHILGALVQLHTSGGSHGNLRPSNIVLDQGQPVYLLDFGQARTPLLTATLSQSRPASDGWYSAPEQLATGLSTPATDVYQVAALLYEMLQGGRLFDAKSFEDLVRRKMTVTPDLSSVDPSIRDLLSRALCATPGRRFSSAGAMLTAMPQAPTSTPRQMPPLPTVLSTLPKQPKSAAPPSGPPSMPAVPVPPAMPSIPTRPPSPPPRPSPLHAPVSAAPSPAVVDRDSEPAAFDPVMPLPPPAPKRPVGLMVVGVVLGLGLIGWGLMASGLLGQQAATTGPAPQGADLSATNPGSPIADPVEPVEPIAKPVEPIAKPVEPVATPTEPIAKPVEPVAKPVVAKAKAKKPRRRWRARRRSKPRVAAAPATPKAGVSLLGGTQPPAPSKPAGVQLLTDDTKAKRAKTTRVDLLGQ